MKRESSDLAKIAISIIIGGLSKIKCMGKWVNPGPYSFSYMLFSELLNFRNDIYRWESFEMLFHPSTWPCFLGKSRLPPYIRKKFDSGADDRLLKYLSPLKKFSFSVSPDLISTAHSWAPASRIKSISWPVLFRQKKALERRPAWSLDLMCSDMIKDSNIFPRR